MLLFWQTLQGMIKQKMQVIIFIILAALLTLLTTSAWIVNSRLTNAYSFMGQGTFTYDYLINFNSKKTKSQNVQTITPWFAFSADYHSIKDVNGIETTLPYLHLGGDGALKALDNSIQINFTFDSTNKITNIVFTDQNPMNGVFLNNGLYRFNFASPTFQKSLIGKFYDQNGKIINPNNLSKIEDFMNNFTRSDISQNTINLFIDYLNTTSPGETNQNVLKSKIIDFINPSATGFKWEKNVDLSQNQNPNIPEITTIKSDIYQNKLNGDLSFLSKDTSQSLPKINLYYSPTITNNNVVGYSENIDSATFTVNDFYNVNNKNSLFNNKPYGPYGLMKTYYELVAEASGFSLQLREEYQYWDLNSNVKYKVINWEQLIKYNQLKIFKRYPGFDPSNPVNGVYVVITPQFAKTHNLDVGDEITIGNNSNLFVGAIGGDTANIYPTVYNTDVFPDPKTDAIIYVSQDIYRNSSIIASSDIDESSLIYLNYRGTANNKDSAVANFKEYLATDFKTLNHPSDINAALQSRDTTKLIYNRYSLLGTTTKVYRIVSYILSISFLIILIFTLVILIKKIINQQKIENGILKANGYSGYTISLSYLSHALITTLIGVPVGWIIGVILQFPIMSVFNNYFVIPTQISFSPYPLLICLGIIGIVSIISILITALRQLMNNPLELLNPNKNIKTSRLMTSVNNMFKFKKFTTKFRFVMMTVSMKKIGWFFLTFFIASTSLTLATLIPTAINKLSKDYYTNLNYKNDYKYTNVIGNIPFSRYQLYDWNGPEYSTNSAYPIINNSLISDYLYSYSSNKWQWLSTKNDITANNANLYAKQINNMIIFNFMAGKGASLSIGTFYDIYNRYGKNVEIRNQIDNLLCTTMPLAFGKQPVIPSEPDVVNRWTYCTQYATNDILPAKIREMWLKDTLAKQQFNFTFGTSTYNANDEDVYTGYNTYIGDNNLELFTYGINANNKTIVFPNKAMKEKLNESSNLDINTDVIPMIINKQAANKYQLNIDNILTTKTNVQQLQYCDDELSCGIDKSAWGYELPNGYIDDNINPYTMDLTKLTVGSVNRFAFNNGTNIPQDYYNLKNFVLKIPVNAFQPGDFINQTISSTTGNLIQGLLDTSADPEIVRKDGQNYIIHPFNNKIDAEINGIGDLTNGFPTNWYREAIRQGLLKIGTIQKHVNYKVIGIQNSYDQPRAYVNQTIANKILGYDTSNSNLYTKKIDNPLLWFNGKFSKYEEQVDQTSRFNLSSTDGSYSMIDFMDSKLTSAIGTTDYLIIKTKVIQKLAWISSILLAIFVTITIVTAIIIVYIMTESFVNSFLNFIAVMKAMGYSNWEINSLTLGIFAPFVVLAWILGIIVMWVTLYLGVYGFSTITAIIIPVGFPWLVLPITFVLITTIFILTYWISTYKINRMNIQEQVNANDI